MDLVEYLSELNTIDLNLIDTQLGIWVDPKDPKSEYRVIQIGNSIEGWKFIGDLKTLSFLGHVSVSDLLTDIAQERGESDVDEFKRMFQQEEFPDFFQQELEGEVYLRNQINAQAAARQFVENLDLES